MTDGLVVLLAAVAIAWLVAGATVVRLLSRIWLRHWAERGLRGASAVVASINRPQRLVAAASVAVGLVLAAAGAELASHLSESASQVALALAGCAAVVVLLAQLLARAVARHWTARLVPWTLPVLRVAEQVAAPILWASRVVRGARARSPASGPVAERAAIQQLLRESELEGVTAKDDAAIIMSVVEFGDKIVRDVMTPRDQVFAVSDAADAHEAAEQVARTAYSRVPVYHGSLDRVTGMLHAFDLLRGAEAALAAPRPVARTTPGTLCSTLLFEMLRDHRHLAIVQDKENHTIGIVTLEDLLEELVGEIRDEHDEPAPASA
ncbi:MAG: CBS domain-containing protein [Gemmatimonadaceae bacterium]|nr:CBS domain-containing protein [Gemmatimonadaceae bacterium]